MIFRLILISFMSLNFFISKNTKANPFSTLSTTSSIAVQIRNQCERLPLFSKEECLQSVRTYVSFYSHRFKRASMEAFSKKNLAYSLYLVEDTNIHLSDIPESILTPSLKRILNQTQVALKHLSISIKNQNQKDLETISNSFLSIQNQLTNLLQELGD